MIAKIKMIIILLLFSGCAQHMAGQEPRSLYQTAERWRLRRLVIAPIQYEVSNGGERQTETENSARRTLLATARKILSDEKGYEVIPLQIYEDIIPQKFNLSVEQFRQQFDLLTEWAKSSGYGEQPPERVAAATSKLGAPLNVDGLVILQGSRSLPGKAATIKCIGGSILVLGPLFPLFLTLVPLFCQMEGRMRADIYEVSTGKIVWRRELWDRPYINVGLPQLFQPLEHAAPKGLTEGQP